MGLRMSLAPVVLALVCSLVAGCGGSSRLSADAYRAKLAALGKEANRAQANVEKGLKAKTVAELEARLKAFAAADSRLGDEASALKPPKDAEAANAELARGESDTAAATRSALSEVAKFTSVKAAVGYLNQSLGNAKGGHELDDALTKLRKLGYATGS